MIVRSDFVEDWLQATALEEAEAARSVLRLVEQLRPHGLPTVLRARLLETVLERQRRARFVSETAARCEREHRPQGLESLAMELAVQVGSTSSWSAVDAWFQGARAIDPEVRRVMRTLAVGRVRHAELSRELLTWMCSQLSEEARQRVAVERQRAMRQFVDSVARPADVRLGRPAPREMRQLLSQLMSIG